MLMISPHCKTASKQKSDLMPKHGRQLVYLCHCSLTHAIRWEFSIGALLFFSGL
jgi:hypothetical protein